MQLVDKTVGKWSNVSAPASSLLIYIYIYSRCHMTVAAGQWQETVSKKQTGSASVLNGRSLTKHSNLVICIKT